METKQDTQHNHIPKPPVDIKNLYKNIHKLILSNFFQQPLQMTSNSNTYKVNNTNDQISSANQRLSNNTQNMNGNNDTYSRPNKVPSTTNGFTSNGNNNANNRQTLRLGTVTIGEYRQQTFRKEPEKFDFISTQKKSRDSGDTTPTNEALQTELQNTLSRSNLRKSNGNSYTEHQRNCPMVQQTMDYGTNGFNVEEISKKLQKSSINDSNSRPMNSSTGTGVGILKNGNRNGGNSSSSKSTEKSIKFG